MKQKKKSGSKPGKKADNVMPPKKSSSIKSFFMMATMTTKPDIAKLNATTMMPNRTVARETDTASLSWSSLEEDINAVACGA